MIINSADLDAVHSYKLLIGSIIPRAIAWVSTISDEGVANLAPISFFTAVGRKPPMVSISLQPRSDEKTLKDTFVNIRETGNFVVNVATLPQAHALHSSAFEFPSGVDEFEALGLEKEPSQAVTAPRIKDELYLERGRIDTAALTAVGRLAAEYTLVENVFTTPLEEDLLKSKHKQRMARLDGQPDDWSPINTAAWSPSGSTLTKEQ